MSVKLKTPRTKTPVPARWRSEVKEILITEEQLAQRVKLLARQIEKDFRGREMVVVSLLNGTILFLADLLRHLNLPLRMDCIGVSSYGQGTESGELVFTKELRLDVRGRDVLLLDDILDTGRTLSRVLPKLKALKPRRIKTCVLLDKPSRRIAKIRADYIGFEIPDLFVVGYGLDFAERYRNLPFVGVLHPHIYKEVTGAPAKKMELKFISLGGWVVMIAVAWTISFNRKSFPWRTVIWGAGLQLVLALLILKTPWGAALFEFSGKVVQKLIQFSGEGTKFVFGPLADGEQLGKTFGPEHGLVFAILITGTVVIVSALSALFYHWGILQRIVRAVAYVMRKAMGTSGSETLSAAANIFMGQTEAPLVIRPYVPRMTRSELMTIMVCGMAHIAGGVAAVYAAMGMQAGYQNTAGHLLTASVLNCPAALMIAKIMLPETEVSETAGTSPATVPRTTANSIDAICRGAGDGFHLAVNIIAMLIAFVAIIALANYVVSFPQTHFGFHAVSPVTLQKVFGWVNAPFAVLMGVPLHDCVNIGQILGERIVLNEFVGYLDLTANAKTLGLDPRSFMIATYALCGFANFSSIAIQVGGIGSLAPERRSEMAKLGFRAMVGGLLAAYMTACLAGFLL